MAGWGEGGPLQRRPNGLYDETLPCLGTGSEL